MQRHITVRVISLRLWHNNTFISKRETLHEILSFAQYNLLSLYRVNDDYLTAKWFSVPCRSENNVIIR